MRMTKFFQRACIVLLLAMFGNGVYFLSEQFAITNRHIPEPISDNKKTEENPSLVSSATKEVPLNLLVLGLDKDKTRCDVIMVFNFNPNTSKLKLLSIARDTRVRDGGRYRKINTLYSRGREEEVADKVTQITGLPIHYYITMDFKGFRKVIDVLGGVEFYVPFSMNYDDPTQKLHIHLKKGWQLLNGRKAEQLVRYRKGNAGQGYLEGDIGRIKMQQEFIKELVRQKLSFKYISKVDELFDIIKEHIRTNIMLSDIANQIENIKKIKMDEIESYTIPGESKKISNVWYYIYDEEAVKEMMETLFVEN